MSQTGSITVVAQGEPADKLLDCLREKVAEYYQVEVDQPDGAHVHVSDPSDSVNDLPAFLDEHLDACAQMLGIPNRGAHLLVDHN
jgi:hypothetical protein